MDDLAAFGFSPRWQALLAEHGPDARPARVMRHDGVALLVATESGLQTLPLHRGLPPITVGDWLACDGDRVITALHRSSLLRRVNGSEEQLLAANVDLVLLVMGLDRPLKAGRVRRGEALAHDAGARPLLVLTKADLIPDLAAVLAAVDRDHPGLDVVATSATTGQGLTELRERLLNATSVLVGESGAGKSRLVNALVGHDVAQWGSVRETDGKGRHTTTSRQLHVLPSGGVVIDSPGIRAVGLAGDEDSVNAAFADIDEIGRECRFADCRHGGEPDCAVQLAVESGELAGGRLDAYQELKAEAASATRRAHEHERRAHERQFTKEQQRYVRSAHHRKK